MANTQSKWVSFFAHVLSLVKPFTSIIDLDKDGDVDSDDIKMLFGKVLDFLAKAVEVVPQWATMTAGQRIDKVVETMKTEFPGVPSCVWIILQGLGWFIQKKVA